MNHDLQQIECGIAANYHFSIIILSDFLKSEIIYMQAVGLFAALKYD